ncbi:MAG: signal peptidase II [Bacillota bacterium]|nr:signal peptidase II [Bacillota bacterium]
MRLFIIAAVMVLFDQFTKYLITTYMEIGQSIKIIENFLYITYVRNPGAAFGMFPYQTVVFVIITIIVVLFIIFYYRVLAEDHFWLRLGLALQLGGALGNLIDRLREGYVIDFINFTIWPPVFNVADSAIVIGIGIFLIAFWRDSALKGERSGSDVS